MEDLSNDYVIIDNDPEDVDPFDTSSQLDNFPIPDDVNSINENSHENPDTSSPINLTGGATGSENSEGDQEDSEQSAASEYDRGAAGGAAGSENSEGDQEDSEQSVAASEYDRGAAGTSTVGVGEGGITNSNEPALRRSARLLTRNVLPDYTT